MTKSVVRYVGLKVFVEERLIWAVKTQNYELHLTGNEVSQNQFVGINI